MTFIDRPLPATLELPRLVDRPRDKRLDNLRHGPGIGRPAGVQDKITRDLKQGLLEGAIAHGYDGEGEDGLVGYCHHLAERHPKMYCHLLAKLLPYNLNANVDGTAPGTGSASLPSGLRARLINTRSALSMPYAR